MSHRLILLAAVMVFTGCARKLPPYEKPIARSQFQRVRTTAYTHTESDHLQHGSQTCIGTTLRHDAVHSAAADWSRWPLGTTFRILETGEICKVDDIGWALSGRNTIDEHRNPELGRRSRGACGPQQAIKIRACAADDEGSRKACRLEPEHAAARHDRRIRRSARARARNVRARRRRSSGEERSRRAELSGNSDGRSAAARRAFFQ